VASVKLTAVNLGVRLGSVEILRGVDLVIRPGEMVAIVGPNGSGKSTLVRALAGLLKPFAGSVMVDQTPVRRMSPRRRATKLGLLVQSADVPDLTTVQEHIGLGRHAMRRLFNPWSAEDARAVRAAMHICEVEHLAHRRMEQLSGGERQRVRLATLLAQDPRVLLLDEPLTGLDIEHQLGLLDLLRSLNGGRARTVVCVLHDLDYALRFFDRVLVIDRGGIAADGPPSEVLCPAVFESVFRVSGRIGCESCGEPVIMCHQRCHTSEGSRPVQLVDGQRSRAPLD
jgi:iron complex transport system ATP-binding protein